MLTVLLFAAIGTFTNAQTGAQTQAFAQVDSLSQCVEILNGNREPIVVPDGDNAGTWYLTDGKCVVVERQVSATYDRKGNRQ